MAAESNKPLIMERLVKIQDLDRSFDVEFWQRQGSDAIFEAAWAMAEEYHRWKDGQTDFRLQRSIGGLREVSR